MGGRDGDGVTGDWPVGAGIGQLAWGLASWHGDWPVGADGSGSGVMSGEDSPVGAGRRQDS